MIPTTDQMDHVTPEERVALTGMCVNCGKWSNFTRGKAFRCPCGSDRVLQSSVHSQRTFDKERAKKETAKYLKGKKK